MNKSSLARSSMRTSGLILGIGLTYGIVNFGSLTPWTWNEKAREQGEYDALYQKAVDCVDTDGNKLSVNEFIELYKRAGVKDYPIDMDDFQKDFIKIPHLRKEQLESVVRSCYDNELRQKINANLSSKV